MLVFLLIISTLAFVQGQNYLSSEYGPPAGGQYLSPASPPAFAPAPAPAFAPAPAPEFAPAPAPAIAPAPPPAFAPAPTYIAPAPPPAFAPAPTYIAPAPPPVPAPAPPPAPIYYAPSPTYNAPAPASLPSPLEGAGPSPVEGSELKGNEIVLPNNSKLDIRDKTGQYSHGFSDNKGTTVSEQGSLISTNEGWEYVLVKKGSYSYTSPEGKRISVNYIADQNGFRVL